MVTPISIKQCLLLDLKKKIIPIITNQWEGYYKAFIDTQKYPCSSKLIFCITELEAQKLHFQDSFANRVLVQVQSMKSIDWYKISSRDSAIITPLEAVGRLVENMSEVCSYFQVNSWHLPVVELLETLCDFLKVSEDLCDFHSLNTSNT